MEQTIIKLLFISLLAAVHSQLNLPSRRGIISETLVYVVEHIGYELSSSFHISYSSISDQSAHHQASIINNFLLKTSQYLLVSLLDIQYCDSRLSEERKFTLLLIDSSEAFQRMEPILKARLYDTNGKHLVLLSQQFDKHETINLIEKVFEEFFRNYIINVELIVRNKTTGLVDFYTFFPISPTYCFKVIPVLHNTFNGSQLTSGFNLFSRKFDNFFGCPLTLVTFPFAPHVFLKHNKDGVKGGGIDIKVLFGVAEKLNFTIVIVDSRERGIQDSNGTLTGALKILYESRANITIGGYGSAAKVMLLFSPSVAYLHTAMVFAVPPMQEYSALERLLLPFESDVWIAIALTFGLTFLSSVLLKAWKRSFRDMVFGRTVRYPVFEMTVVYLGGAVSRFPKGAIARNVVLQWLIVSLVLSSCYKAILFGMQKKGFLKKFPNTVEGMLDKGYVIDVPLPLMQNLKDGPLGGRDAFYLLKYNIHTHYAILQTGIFKRMVVDTNIQLQHFNSIYYENGILQSLPQRLFIFPMYFYYRKESYLVKPIDDVLTKCIQSGLITFWKDSVLNISHLEKTKTSNIMKPLLVKNFQGCFALCGVLLACSLVIFALELLFLQIDPIKRNLLLKKNFAQ